MRAWTVGGAVIERHDHLLLVCNRRRDGELDWTTPGGVIDQGESVLEGLSREVREETGIEVATWSAPLYEVDVVFEDLGSHLRAIAHHATEWVGELTVEDPDGIVVDADFVAGAARDHRLTMSPRWVREPLLDWMQTRTTVTTDVARVEVYRYVVRGADRTTMTVERR